MTVGVTLPVLDRAYRAYANQAVAPLGLSQALAWPLVIIGRHGDGLRQGVVAELLGIEGPSLARSLDYLIEAGLVERREDAGDRRAKTLSLTEPGRVARAQIEEVLFAMRKDLFQDVADTDLQACLRVFAALQQRLGGLPPGTPGAGRSAARKPAAS
ncbi:MAG: MarR family transcriptional regulator [Burkholderiaceae bacterium]